MKYTVKFEQINSVNIVVEANSEEEAYDEAWCAWAANIAPDMEIVKVK
jgi:hypothetical protein